MDRLVFLLAMNVGIGSLTYECLYNGLTGMAYLSDVLATRIDNES
jgi:hypothetical protein